MAENNQGAAAPGADPVRPRPGETPRTTVETTLAEGRGASFIEGGESESFTDEGFQADFGVDIPSNRKPDKSPGDEGSVDGEAGKEGGEGGRPEATSDLPAYDPASEEAVKAYDAKYMVPGKDGSAPQLNTEVIGQEFWDNFNKVDPKDRKPFGHLNADTYAFLKDTYQVDDTFIREIEEGMTARAEKMRRDSTSAFYSKIEGGKSAHDAAIEWAKGGGYSAEQRARYNDLQKKGGPDFEDAVDALMARFRRANPNAAFGNRQDRGPGRRRSSPQRDISGGGTAGNVGTGGDTYGSFDTYQAEFTKALEARRAARASGDRTKMREADNALDRIQQKARRSKVR